MSTVKDLAGGHPTRTSTRRLATAFMAPSRHRIREERSTRCLGGLAPGVELKRERSWLTR